MGISLISCSPPGSGGNAAPSGGVGIPVAVEIPSLDSVGDLLYITGPVVMDGGANISAKSVKAANQSVAKGMGLTSKFGNSLNACETRNFFWGMMSDGAQTDLELCLLKNYVAPSLTNAGVNMYDGNYHNASIKVDVGHGMSDVIFRFRLVKDDSGNLSKFNLYACEAGVQTLYSSQTITGDTAIITSKNLENGNRHIINATGSLNDSAQYTSKVIDSEHYDPTDDNSTIRTRKGEMIQEQTNATLSAFYKRAGETEVVQERIFSAFGIDYAGPIILDPSQYQILNGAGHLIYGHTDQTECWDANGNKSSDPRDCNPYLAIVEQNSPMAVQDVAPISFSADESVNCALLDDITTAPPVEIANSVCSGFALDNNQVDCHAKVDGEFAVVATINGELLSTDASNPTSVTLTPTILLSLSYEPYLASFNSGNIILEPYEGNIPVNYGNNLIGDDDFSVENWSHDYTRLTLTHHLTPGTVYRLTLTKDLGGVGSMNHPTAAGVYYISVP
ncbi:MAG: hypothetical protein COV45_08955 [Deltaproteobacteria bacterium CG11_big_fil_rev_8_21_14_0_20_47_16]|nr:MAG: hypothetical protein COV45_08955 [Deltaproteobacteria bacterium CG11_big_fil_rev_8_21_14_0_20_47_16]